MAVFTIGDLKRTASSVKYYVVCIPEITAHLSINSVNSMKFAIVLVLASVLLAAASTSAASVEKDVTELQIGVKVSP